MQAGAAPDLAAYGVRDHEVRPACIGGAAPGASGGSPGGVHRVPAAAEGGGRARLPWELRVADHDWIDSFRRIGAIGILAQVAVHAIAPVERNRGADGRFPEAVGSLSDRERGTVNRLGTDATPRAPRIVHVSSVHAALDPRIRRKELASVVDRGWRATFVTGDLDAEEGDGVEVIRVAPGNGRRFPRLSITSWRCVLRAFSLDADLYHLHDPELLIGAWLLRLRAPVVYDVHEDYVTSLEQKTWLPKPLRRPLAALLGRLEVLASTPCVRVIAERYYARRFPGAVPILNYPAAELLDRGSASEPGSGKLLYTGNVTRDRGAEHMTRVLDVWPEASLTIVGRCSAGVAAAMRDSAGQGLESLHLVGEERYVPFEEIVQHYRAGGWLAGVEIGRAHV